MNTGYSTMRNLIIYHRNCTDGFTAAWIAHRALGGGELVAAHYGEAPPLTKDRRVFVVDFSYPRATLDAMLADCDSLLVLDHHKTAAEDLANHPHAKFDMAESGASLTWRHFHPDAAMPKLVGYVKDRDLWAWALPNSREVSEYIRLQPTTLEGWDSLAAQLDSDDGLTEAVSVGCALRAATAKRVEDAACHPVPLMIGGVPFQVTNATTDFSELAGALSADTGAGAAYFVRQDGRVQFSLRSEARTVDVAAVAKLYGGGGHPAAAGFDVSMQGFLGILGGADIRATGESWRWFCVRCGGGWSENHCHDCGAGSSCVCVPTWAGEAIYAEYLSRQKSAGDRVRQATLDEVEKAVAGEVVAELFNGAGIVRRAVARLARDIAK